jgi:hypothetical protein
VTPDSVALINRKLTRAREEHVSELLSILNAAIAVIHPNRSKSVSESIALFSERTLNALKTYSAQVQPIVLSVIEDASSNFGIEDKTAVLTVIERYFDPTLYVDRFETYEGAIKRHMSRLGITVDLSSYRVDLTKALNQVACTNFIRTFIASLADDLEIVARRCTRPLQPMASHEGKLEQANRLVKLEPNLFGIGINLNYLIRRLLGRRE